jgi:hypothetical protein
VRSPERAGRTPRTGTRIPGTAAIPVLRSRKKEGEACGSGRRHQRAEFGRQTLFRHRPGGQHENAFPFGTRDGGQNASLPSSISHPALSATARWAASACENDSPRSARPLPARVRPASLPAGRAPRRHARVGSGADQDNSGQHPIPRGGLGTATCPQKEAAFDARRACLSTDFDGLDARRCVLYLFRSCSVPMCPRGRQCLKDRGASHRRDGR